MYDPLGRLRSYTLPSPTIGFVYDGANIAGAYNGTTMLHRYVLGAGSDEALVDFAVPTGTANYLSTDERGSVIAKSNASGTATGKDSYDEYGRRGSTSNTYSAYGYTGQVDLAPLPLYYYKARMYSPALGRFVQTDPIGYGDGLNWYNYAGSDPVNLSDPSGLLCTITSYYTNWYSPDEDGNLVYLNTEYHGSTTVGCGSDSRGYDRPLSPIGGGGGGPAGTDAKKDLPPFIKSESCRNAANVNGTVLVRPFALHASLIPGAGATFDRGTFEVISPDGIPGTYFKGSFYTVGGGLGLDSGGGGCLCLSVLEI